MIRYIRLLILFIKLRISKSIIYSLNFWIAFFVDTVLFLFQILAFASIYQFIDTINGWTLNQMFIFIGTFSIVDSLAMGSYFFGLLYLPQHIRTGSLDIRITKPIDTQFYVSIENFSPGSFFGLITGGAMVSYGLIKGGYTIGPMHIFGYILLVFMMYSIMYSLMLIIRTFAFHFIKIDALVQAEDSVVDFAFRIPGTAYRGVAKFVFLILIPYGMVATVPTQFITNLLTPNQWLIVVGVTVFFNILARIMFQFGMSRYSSASS